MSPWTALLESLHSALIDELIERHPEPKPELGMPSRHRELRAPSTDMLKYCVASVTNAGNRGIALIAMDAKAEKALNLAPPALWEVVFRRAGTEFHRRRIMPVLERAEAVTDLGKISAGLQKVVWVPFKLGDAKCFLGVGT